MKKNRLLSFLTAAMIGTAALLSAGIPTAAEGSLTSDAAAVPDTVSIADVYALRDFLLGEDYLEGSRILDMDQNGVLNAKDLTLAKRVALNTLPELSLHNLRADIPDILLNEEETVTFTVSANRPGLSETVALYDGENEEPAAFLHDDGKDGDETANDCIYSAQLQLISDDFKNVDYYAASEACKSKPFRICFYRDLTPEEYGEFGELMERIGENETYADALEAIKNNPEIVDYLADEPNKTITFQTVYHITGIWDEPYEEDDVLGRGKFAIENYSSQMFWGTLGQTIYDAVAKCQITPAHPEKTDVIVLTPFKKTEIDDLKQLVGAFAEECGAAVAKGLGSTVKMYSDANVTRNLIRNLDQYGTVIWYGHGSMADFSGDLREGEVPCLHLSETIDWARYMTDPGFFASQAGMRADAHSGRIYVSTKGSHYVIGPDFFDHYYPEGALDNSFWYLSACCSMTNDALAETLLSKGAEAVVGNSEPAHVPYADKVLFETLVNSMLLSAMNVREAVAESNDMYGRDLPVLVYPDAKGSMLRYAGDRSFRLVEQIEEAVPDDPDFVADNTLKFTQFKGADGTYQYRVSGKAKNVYVQIPSSYEGLPVTEIEQYGFRNCTHLEYVSIPPTITKIPYCAFLNCTSLQTVNLPSSVTEIGDSAFAVCSSLEEFVFPPSLKKIGQQAFGKCTKLAHIDLPSTVKSIGQAAFHETAIRVFEFHTSNSFTELNQVFMDCKALENVVLDMEVEKLEATFYGCPKLSKVLFPKGLKTLHQTFYGDYGLTEITVPEGVETIDYRTFYYCTGLETLILPNSVTTFATEACAYCSKLKTVVLSDQIKTIESFAFRDCKELTDVTMPAYLEKIGPDCFSSCFALRSLDVPDSVTEIGARAFWQCSVLTLKGLPQSIQKIGVQAFYRTWFEVDRRYPYPLLEIPEGLTKLDITAFDGANLNGLIIRNPNIEFAELVPGDKYWDIFKYASVHLDFYGYEGSTTQAFTENPDHPGFFIPIEQCPLYQNTD